MKRFLVLMISLVMLLGLAQISFGAERSFEMGVAYQIGDYDLTYDSGNSTGNGPMETGIPAPKLILTLKEQIGNWSLTGFYGDSNLRKIDENETLWNYETLDFFSNYAARSRAWGVDLGYTFVFNKLTVTPTLGYRDTLMTFGFQDIYDGEYLLGYEIKGWRLGIDLNYALTSKVSLKAGVGFGVSPQYIETEKFPSEPNLEINTVYTPKSQSVSFTDYLLELNYQFTPLWAASLGYRYETGSLEGETANIYPENKYDSGRFLLGVNYSIGMGNETVSGAASGKTELELEIGVAYQDGDYDLTYDTDNLTGNGPMKVSIPAPEVIITVKKQIGHWSLAGSYGDSRLKKIGENSYAENWLEYDEPFYAHSRVWAADLGYTFKFNKLAVTPTLGYHDTLMTSGGYLESDNGNGEYLYGYEIKGLHFGVDLDFAFTSKMSLKAGVGFGISPQYKEIGESDIYNTNGYHKKGQNVLLNSNSASYTDYLLELSYQFTPHWAASLGYRYETGCIDTDTPGGILELLPDNEYKSSRILAGVNCRF